MNIKEKMKGIKFYNANSPSMKLLRNLSFILIILTISSLMLHIHQYSTINAMKDRNQFLKNELNKFTLKNPSIEDLHKFLSNDNTNQKDRSNWDCKDFAIMLRLNARKNGFNMCVVLLEVNYVIKSVSRDKEYWAPSTGLETINGAILDNGTFVYIDPQDDQIIRFDRYSLELKLLEKNNDALVAAIINETHIW